MLENGRLALEQYRQLKPDLVTMEVVMPRVSGTDAVCAIRQEEVEAIQAGVAGFVGKPFQPSAERPVRHRRARPAAIAARFTRCFPLLFALLLLVSDRLAAQLPPGELIPGARVRVTAPEVVDRRFVATVAEVGADTLTVEEASGGRVALPLSAITSLERSLGRSRRASARRGAVVGLVAGVGLGVVCVAVCPTDGPGANMAPVGGFFYGPPVGAALGLLIAPERWQRLRLPRRPHVPAVTSETG